MDRASCTSSLHRGTRGHSMKVMVNFPPTKSQIPKPDPIKCASYYKLLEITVTNPTEAVTLVGLKTNKPKRLDTYR